MSRRLIGAVATTPTGEQWIAAREGNVFAVRLSVDGRFFEWQLHGEPNRWQAVPLDRVKYLTYDDLPYE